MEFVNPLINGFDMHQPMAPVEIGIEPKKMNRADAEYPRSIAPVASSRYGGSSTPAWFLLRKSLIVHFSSGLVFQCVSNKLVAIEQFLSSGNRCEAVWLFTAGGNDVGARLPQV